MEYEEEQAAGGQRVVKVPSLVDAFGIPAVVDAFFNQVVDDIAALAKDHPNAIHGHVLFGLLRALYKHNQKVGAEGNENLIARLADWARGPAGTAFDGPIPQEPSLRRALLLMTIGDILGAVEAATNAGHIRLALIISRALEVPKEDLREDAAAQLSAYYLPVPSIASDSSTDLSEAEGEECRRDLLDVCNGSEAISVDERMILLLLAGRIPPVAQYLGLHGTACSSWNYCTGRAPPSCRSRSACARRSNALGNQAWPRPHHTANRRTLMLHTIC